MVIHIIMYEFAYNDKLWHIKVLTCCLDEGISFKITLV